MTLIINNEGVFTGEGTKLYIPANITIDGMDYTCKIKKAKINKRHKNRVKAGALFYISNTGTVHIKKLPKITQAEIDQIKKTTEELMKLFEE